MLYCIMYYITTCIVLIIFVSLFRAVRPLSTSKNKVVNVSVDKQMNFLLEKYFQRVVRAILFSLTFYPFISIIPIMTT